MENTINEEQIRTINKRRLKSSIIIYPDSVLRNIVDFVSFCIILWISLYIPFVFTFDIDTSTGYSKYLEMCIDLWFLSEMVLNFFTGYYEKGILILDKKRIAKTYLK